MNSKIKNVMNVPVDGSQYRDKIELTKFESVIPQRNEFLQSKHNDKLLEYGITKPFFVWITTDESGSIRYYLMTNHSDFRLALEHCLPFQIVLKNFLNEDMVTKFIIEDVLTTDSLTLFQKGMMILKQKEIIHLIGKTNMVNGGKGVPVEERSHTMDILSSWIGCSHETLNRIEFILENLEDESILKMVENNEISISKVYHNLREQINNSKRKENYFPDKQKELDSLGLEYKYSPSDLPITDSSVQKLKYVINEEGKYTIVYIDTQFNSLGIRNVKEYIEDLKKMNIKDSVYQKWCTLFIQTSPMFLSETMEIIKFWGFNCVETKTVTFTTEKFKSKYSTKYNEVILICEKNNVGVHHTKIKNPIENGSVSSDTVLDLIDSMLEDGMTKMGVFMDYREGWDTYNFMEETSELVRLHKNTG
jgi:hypothetical protein